MTDRHRRPRVFNIAPGLPFLPTLADGIVSGELTGVEIDPGDPLALANVTIFLPTRRAARALRSEFLARASSGATLLPVIRPIAEVEEDILLLTGEVHEKLGGPDDLTLPPAIDPVERRLALTRLALAWSGAIRNPSDEGTGPDLHTIPANPADAAHLAGDLERVMDAVANEGVGYAGLKDLVPDDFARFWQLTLDFLAIVTAQWPQYLAERGALDGIDRRNRLILAEAARLAGLADPGPIVAAGSTGSLPATAQLLATISRLPNGAVVLPGLDGWLDDVGWRAIGGTNGVGGDKSKGTSDPVPGHPQFGLKGLIGTLGLARDEIVDLGEPPADLAARAELLSQALRPAATTDGWAEFHRQWPPENREAGLQGLSLLVCDNESEEALAIALALRQHTETSDGQAALVTPDRNLARRVAAELNRWEIAVDDSAGLPLSRTPPGAIAQHLATVAFGPWDPIALLALLKHPLATFGRSPGAIRRLARRLELALLRGPRLEIEAAGLVDALVDLRARLTSGALRPNRAQSLLAEVEWTAVIALAGDITQALKPLTDLAEGGKAVPADQLAAALDKALSAVCAAQAIGETDRTMPGEAEMPLHLAGQAGRGLNRFLGSLVAAEHAGLRIAPAEFPDLLSVLMDGVTVTPTIAEGRIHIWGALEARLQTVDLMILGGLNEGTWPGDTRLDPWLSRPMRAGLGLSAPERRIGLQAHDFAGLAALPNVILSRAERSQGAPSIASRWLLRLLALIGKDSEDRLTGRAGYLRQWARVLDTRAIAGLAPAIRPNPTPLAGERPRGLSVTEIETWIRDPYAIYARHILRLRPIEAIGAEPDMADRGSLIHRILADYTRARLTMPERPPLDLLIEVGREHFAGWRNYPDIVIYWWPRFLRAADWFVAWEDRWREAVDETFGEISGDLDLPRRIGGFTLHGRADRIDRLSDGSLAILDYKTGQAPSNKQIEAALAPQLPLEAALAGAGAFTGLAGAPVSRAGYIILSGQHPPGRERLLPGKLSVDDLAERVLEKLEALIASYRVREQGYLSRARPAYEAMMDGAYDHLARTREWSLGGDDEP